MVSVLLGGKVATKKKGLAKLIGKQITLRLYTDKETDPPRGSFTLLDVDHPMVELKYEDKVFWWNLKDIEGIKEVMVAEQ